MLPESVVAVFGHEQILRQISRAYKSAEAEEGNRGRINSESDSSFEHGYLAHVSFKDYW